MCVDVMSLTEREKGKAIYLSSVPGRLRHGTVQCRHEAGVLVGLGVCVVLLDSCPQVFHPQSQLARDALRDLLSIQNRQISVENIQKTVADYYKIKVADMYSKKRPASIARPRQIAMYLAKEMTQKSLPEIGELFGGRDHTTVLHAVRKINAERQQLTELNQQLHVLEQSLKG
jgi:hypothetical protein